ncbi:MAG TPA: ATP phosphoribosyltransferase regulatory subunit [bacterium]|nr:ATP phosphoribosyltransferase regulatory subunit [bacterium]
MRVRSTQSGRWQQVPAGVRDYAAPDAARHSALAASVRSEFMRWGYAEVRTPPVEYLETIVRGAGAGIQDHLFKIVDTGGELLVLRPEMTVPIARLAATRLLPQAAGPLRLSYVADVFRGQDEGRTQLRAFTQAGVELLGEGTLDADAEVIALAATCLRRAGVPDAVVHVGHLGFLDDLLAALPAETQDEIRARLYRKEFAGIEHAIPDPSLAGLLRLLPDLHGDDAVTRATPFATSARSRAALADLETLMARLRDYGLADIVRFDLSIIRDFSYYTGVVFEAYGAGSGYPLAGGGRYDTLLGRFGAECPATGFALGLDRVLSVLPTDGDVSIAVVLVADPSQRPEAIQIATDLRRRGVSVLILGAADDAPITAQRNSYRWVVRMTVDGIVLQDMRTETQRLVDRATLIAVLGTPSGDRVSEWTR